MKADYYSYRKSQIHYYRFGNGPQPVACFHGYGEDAASFVFLEKYAGDVFTFYSIDLPWHGNTQWNENLPFTISQLQEIVAGILSNQWSDDHPKPILMGYSLGGRMVLSLYEAESAQVERIVLLAPDGLKVNFWYWLATQTWAGNKFFAFTMKKPGWFFGMLKVLNKLKLVNASIFKFVNFYIGNKEVRHQLYTRWTGLRKIRPHLSSIKKSVRKHETPVRLIYGKHDRIILSSVGEKFKKGIEEHCTITVINAGHQVLQERYLSEIMQNLL